eukprot:15453514-Alexandrium_andersonii.AAC.1
MSPDGTSRVNTEHKTRGPSARPLVEAPRMGHAVAPRWPLLETTQAQEAPGFMLQASARLEAPRAGHHAAARRTR